MQKLTPLTEDSTRFQLYDLQEARMDISASYLKLVMIVSLCNLLFPVNIIMEWNFARLTNRSSSEIDMNFFNELILFLASLLLIYKYYTYHGFFDPENIFARREMSPDQLFISNIIWEEK